VKIKRIFLSIPINASSGFNDSIWERIFLDTLVELGYEVYFFPYHKAKQMAGDKAGKEEVSQRILDEFNKQDSVKKFDLFFSYFHERHVLPSLFEQLKSRVFVLNYTTNFHQISQYNGLLRNANLSTFPSLAARDYFNSNGINGYYLPFAGLKKIGREPRGNKNGKLSFIGTAYGNRPYYLWRILQQQIPLDIYGYGWLKKHKLKAILRGFQIGTRVLLKRNILDHTYRMLNDLILDQIAKKFHQQIYEPLIDAEYFNLLSKSSIIVNFPESRFDHDYNNPNVLMGANLRDFEVPIAGGCLLTQYNNEIVTFFEPDKEILTFANEWEMVEKAKYYLSRPDLIDAIALAGYKRAISDHTWENRFRTLFQHIEKNML